MLAGKIVLGPLLTARQGVLRMLGDVRDQIADRQEQCQEGEQPDELRPSDPDTGGFCSHRSPIIVGAIERMNSRRSLYRRRQGGGGASELVSHFVSRLMLKPWLHYKRSFAIIAKKFPTGGGRLSLNLTEVDTLAT